ncbi:two-component system, sensor histidine kinase YesM [Ruminococcaceae bacterium KH2T8]|nr:two-component system, sensor histidine kinase YesM [Ruminococcaceae bacterium KH2T8]
MFRGIRKISGGIVSLLNNLSLRKKLWLLYTFCVFIPLVLTDGLIAIVLFNNAQKEMQKNMETAAYNASLDFRNVFDTAENLSNTIYINDDINFFLETQFASNREFYSEANTLKQHAGYSTLVTTELSNVVFCADNDTLVSAGSFATIDKIRDTQWYTDFVAAGRKKGLYFYFSEASAYIPVTANMRMVTLVRDLDYFSTLSNEKIVRIDIDYSRISSIFSKSRYGVNIYICEGDMIVLSTNDKPNTYSPYKYLTSDITENIGYEMPMHYMDKDYRILVEKPTDNYFFISLREHIAMLTILLLMNIVLPLVLVNLINVSFTSRLHALSQAFAVAQKENGGLTEVDKIEGTDEISSLMRGYNDLVKRNRLLIKTIYEDRIIHQKVEIEKQQAELLSMRMQINPHFIFNVLENIRMNSIVKGEKETASMIERLAALERESVDWKYDVIPLSREIAFIRNYLKLQQMRYGERFSFTINVEEGAKNAYIPKLTLATFVENSCVHGVEKKSSSAMILIDASIKDDKLILEVEDTGAGMSQAAAAALQTRMRKASFSQLQNSSKHIGIINSCLRIKMIAGEENVNFTFEGEENVGVYLRIEMPIITDPGEDQTWKEN